MSKTVLQSENCERAAECLRTLSHLVRLQIAGLLLHGRYTVSALAEPGSGSIMDCVRNRSGEGGGGEQ